MNDLTSAVHSDDLAALLTTLPEGIRRAVVEHGDEDNLLEIVLDLGRPPYARFLEDELELRASEVTEAELQMVM
ncbi:MAG: hypothetical protein OXG42_05025, partial [Chloroflexi bacterium]|nr:hypothetical protein [Chloroflexota bacterium]